MASLSQLFLFATAAYAQQYYISASGPTTRPQCPTHPSATKPSYGFTSFSYTLSETVRTATSVPSPTTTRTYAAPFESLTSLVPSLSYTTWGSWNPNATVPATDTDDSFGNAAWTALWEYANPPNFTERGLYSTTVFPTPIPSSELVLPPRDYFGPTDCYYFPESFMFGVSSSSSQIEGATAEEGKGPTLMDILIQDGRPTD
jgi:Glycosyl hydrolase family 1